MNPGGTWYVVINNRIIKIDRLLAREVGEDTWIKAIADFQSIVVNAASKQDPRALPLTPISEKVGVNGMQVADVEVGADSSPMRTDPAGESGSPDFVVLEVGGEGGSITVRCRIDSDGVRRFGIYSNESLFDDEGERFPDSVPGTSKLTFGTFDAMLVGLDQYPWPKLYPLSVHPDYYQSILAEVGQRAGEMEVERWRNEVHPG